MPNSNAPARKLPSRKAAPPPSNTELESLKGGRGLRKVKNRLKIFSIRLGMDMSFFFLVCALVIIGIIMMYSASYPSALAYENDSQNYLGKQVMFALIGFGLMMFLSYFDYHYFHRLAPIIMIVSIMLLVIVLFTGGYPRRWLHVGVDIQVSEIAKFAVILFFAHWSSNHFREMHTFRKGVLPLAFVLILVAVLVFMEPHYSGVVIITIIATVMMFIGGVRKRYFIIAAGLVAAVILVLLATNKLGYAMSRLDGWGMALTYVDDELWDNTRQTRNSLYAIGSGGIWGLGLGQSRQKYMYIPEVQNDFVFAVVCEELGLVGATIILLLFVLLVWRGVTIAKNAKDPFGSMLAAGLSAQVGIQTIINILVITDWMPNTGIGLPFFSYGGSSLLMMMAQMGIILSISRTSNLEKV